MSWLKPSMYIAGVLIVAFGGALLLDLAASMLGLTNYWLPDHRQTHQQVELQYYEMWTQVGMTPQVLYSSQPPQRAHQSGKPLADGDHS